DLRSVIGDAPVGFHEDDEYVATFDAGEIGLQRRGRGQRARGPAAGERVEHARNLHGVGVGHGRRELRDSRYAVVESLHDEYRDEDTRDAAETDLRSAVSKGFVQRA